MNLEFHTLDVFTKERFGGNPLAVVLGADMLPSALMQTIAREFNLSETVFVMKPKTAAHTARLRIFTPSTELPFAGHPTIGTAALLAQLRKPGEAQAYDAIMLLEEEIGPVRVSVGVNKGGAAHAEFTAPKLPEIIGSAPAIEDISAALGLIPAEIGCENYSPLWIDAGNNLLFVPVASRAALTKAGPVQPYWDEVIGTDLGAYVYCHEPVHTTSAYQARMFAPTHGIAEDPATGSAAAAFAGVVQHFDRPPDGTHKRILEQGFQMGRESFINLTLVVSHGELDGVRISGDVVRVASGTIAL